MNKARKIQYDQPGGPGFHWRNKMIRRIEEKNQQLRPQKKPEGSPLNNVPSSPQQAMNMHLGGAFPFSLVPSTSTASSQASVIMSSSDSARDDVTPPAGKRIKTEEDEEKSARLLTGLLPQGFPSLPFMLPGGLPQQFQMPDMDSLNAMNTPKQPGAVKRQYSSNGKNYCDLCNKEVCNKYFLRTHMLKMHGIVIDENKTVIANIDTLEKEHVISVIRSTNPDIYFGKHKQDVHGVVPLSTPSNRKPSTMSSPAIGGGGAVSSDEKLEKCPLCERRMPASNLTAHIQNEHTGGGGMSMTQAPPASPTMRRRWKAHSAVAHNGLNLTVRKEKKEENDVETEKIANERNSHTSGSMSPSGESLPEGFGKPDSGSCDEKHVMQSFVLRCTADASGAFLSEMIAHLPVRTLLSQPTRVSFELVPHQVSSDSNPF
ncbi:zinc finger, C2H2 type [Ostertagia ostertagi]